MIVTFLFFLYCVIYLFILYVRSNYCCSSDLFWLLFFQSDYNNRTKPFILKDEGDYSIVNVSKTHLDPDLISRHCQKIRESVYKLIESYSHTFNVDFELSSSTYEFSGEIFCA